MWKCPNCEETIEHLNYSVHTTSSEWGSASLSDEPRLSRSPGGAKKAEIIDYDSDQYGDTEWDGSPTYECPECNDQIGLDTLIWAESKEEKEEKIKPPKEIEPEESLHNIINPEKRIQVETNQTKPDTIICKHCKYLFVYGSGEKAWYGNQDIICECPKCGESNSTAEFETLLKTGFFR